MKRAIVVCAAAVTGACGPAPPNAASPPAARAVASPAGEPDAGDGELSNPYKPPDYADPTKISEESVTVGTGKWALPATLTLPKGATGCPAVVLVHGSGPNDRDETVGANKPFRDLALGLGSRGIGVLRYEKRSKQHGKAMVAELGDRVTVKEETVDDALAALSELRAHPRVDTRRTFVLGHSLGGTAIPRIAAADDRTRGFIIFAGSTQPLEDIVLRQMRYIASLDGKVSEKERKVLDQLEAQAKRVKGLTASSKVAKSELPLGIAVPYWLDLRANPPAKAIAGETRPILVLHGDRDYQVTLSDFEGWKGALAGRSNATFKRYPKANHLFIEGAGKSTPAEYQRPGHVARQVVEDIAAWIKRQ